MSEIKYNVCDICGRKLGKAGFKKIVLYEDVFSKLCYINSTWDLCDDCAATIKAKIEEAKINLNTCAECTPLPWSPADPYSDKEDA